GCVSSLLKAVAGAGLLWPRRARAFGDASRRAFSSVRHGGRWGRRADGRPRLGWEVAKRTSIETSPIVRALSAADPELFRYPFAVLSSDVVLPPMADAEVSALRRYLSYGGFLLVDDASALRCGPVEISA